MCIYLPHYGDNRREFDEITRGFEGLSDVNPNPADKLHPISFAITR